MQQITCNKCQSINPGTNKYCHQCGYALPKPKVQAVKTEIAHKQKKSKNKKTGIILGALLAVICFFGVSFLFKTPSIAQNLIQVSNTLNKSCPIIVDADTRLDNTIALPNNVFQYNYTLINLEKKDIDPIALQEFLYPRVLQNIKTNPDMAYFKNNKVTLGYYYIDKNGVFILKLEISPEEYL